MGKFVVQHNFIFKAKHACPEDPSEYFVTKRNTHLFSYERKRTRNGIQKGDIITEEHSLYLHLVLDTDKVRIDRTLLMKDIRHVKKQLEEGIELFLLTKAEACMANSYLIIRSVRGRRVITLNDKETIKATRLYRYFVLISNKKMNAFSALREYRLREKMEEGFRLDKQYNDEHVTRTKSTESLEGRFLC